MAVICAAAARRQASAKASNESGSKEEKSGLGLGLAIAHHIVQLHGGTISADSKGEGQGATFTVILPLLH